MKKNWNRIFALCLTLALVFSLAACGQKADEPDAQDEQQTEQEEFTPARLLHRRAQGADRHGPCEADEGQREWRNDWQ